MSIFGRREIAELKADLERKEQEIDSLKQSIEELNSCIDFDKNEDRDCYNFRMKIVRDKKLAASVYKSKDFMSSHEFKLYMLLCEISSSEKLKEYELTIFSQVRLADIVKMWEENLEEFKEKIVYSSGGKTLTNRSKEKVYSEMEKENFNDRKFNKTFLYPLLRSHVDFLICRPKNDTLIPLMAIELFGKEHFESKNIKRQSNDEFKKLLFEAVGVGFDNSLTNEALKEALNNSDKMDALKSELEGKILGIIRRDNRQ